ncbi:hypothetical protein C5167_001644 [Papaver somniferum]|uniref:Cytochrome c-type biogenesis protein CcmE n=2 Tax=Papaver somniferum TaxID=3469 RepID=A0A4Y7KZU8_PAPSO|nr:hypothetical protein C5167_001644 [Papaver somniferum]
MATAFRKGLRSLGSRILINKTITTRQFSNRPLASIIHNQSTSLFYNLYKNPSTESQFFRQFSSQRVPKRPNKIDIGARARKLQQQRLWTYALAFGGVAGFVYLVLVNFEDQLVFYVTPTEAFEKYKANPSKNRFRLGGLVLEGSVTTPSSSATMEFVVTDLITDILVRYEGSLPDLFREGHSAIVEGAIFPLTDEIRKELASNGKSISEKATTMDYYFNGSEVLAKHDDKYMPQEVAAALERNKEKLKEEAEAQAEEEAAKVEEAVKSEEATKTDKEVQRESVV